MVSLGLLLEASIKNSLTLHLLRLYTTGITTTNALQIHYDSLCNADLSWVVGPLAIHIKLVLMLPFR